MARDLVPSPPPLEPLEERDVEFYGDSVTAVLVTTPEGPQVFIPIRPLTETLALDRTAQFRRINRNRVLREVSRTVLIRGRGLNPQDMVCLPLDFLYGWLLGLEVDRIKPELQERVYLYQRECYRVLAAAFQQATPVLTDPTPSPEIAELAKIRDMYRAMALMADEQIALAQRTADAHTRLDRAGQVVKQIDQRLAVVEQRLDPRNILTDEQAAAVSQRVRELGLLLSVQDKSKNHFQGIFSELYRRYQASDYKHIRQGQFTDVMTFLAEWGAALRIPT